MLYPSIQELLKATEKDGKESFNVTIDDNAFGEGIDIVSLNRNVSVSVTHKNTSTIQLKFNSEDIEVNNPHSLKYNLPNSGLIVTFRCATDKLSYANVENVTAFIDLSSVGAAENSTQVSVSFSYADSVSGSIYEIGRHTVEVEFVQGND
jgi:hypothetical protein